MKLHTINSGLFKLDGGAMFGIIPKTIWQKINPADENNMATWNSRCWIIELNNRLILIDCGLGDKQGPDFFKHYYRDDSTNLIKEIHKAGFKETDFTDVIITHFHFDHCGGALSYDHQKKVVPTFPNAQYHCSLNQWENALQPNFNEENSIFKDNIFPSDKKDFWNLIDSPIMTLNDKLIVHEFLTDLKFIEVNGHSKGLLVPWLKMDGEDHIFCSDLIPSFGHIPILYSMAYDANVSLTYQEKQSLYQSFNPLTTWLYFQHDPKIIRARFMLKGSKYGGVL
ncbi:MAG: MBL fold metallo-hydrolase [Sediminibacterium sp.]|nr:MBL fold metallo-hydrolase [Sediminibacterium sp.]